MRVQQPDASTCAPYQPRDILSLLGSAPFSWWITGGWSIDLFLGKKTRNHFDVDIAISRDDQLLAQNYLNNWDFWAVKRDKDGNIVLCEWEMGYKLGKEYPVSSVGFELRIPESEVLFLGRINKLEW